MWIALKTPDLATLSQLNTIYSGRAIQYSADNRSQMILLRRRKRSLRACRKTIRYILFAPVWTKIIQNSLLLPIPNIRSYSNLLNGADTYLRILAPDGITPIAENDNIGNVTYTAPFNCDALNNDICHENGNDLLASRSILTSQLTRHSDPAHIMLRSPQLQRHLNVQSTTIRWKIWILFIDDNFAVAHGCTTCQKLLPVTSS